MQDHLETLKQFRQDLYQSFPYRRDSLIELLDAFSSNEQARSVVEMSLNPLFRRQYSALYKAIACAYQESSFPVCSLEAYRQGQVVLATVPTSSERRYQVFGIDETPYERLYARCVSDRQIVHRSTSVPGQVPISVGHNYSILAALPEGADKDWPRWAVPVSVERVSSLSNAIEVAHGQIAQLMSYPQMHLETLKVLTVDSRYPTPAFLDGLRDYPDLVVIARVRGNRIIYRQPEVGKHKTRPRWYGDPIRLHDRTTWPAFSEQTTLTLPTESGEHKSVQLWRWSNLLMRGTADYRMHQCPFDLVGIQPLDPTTSTPIGSPLWLLVWGQQRQAFSVTEVRHLSSASTSNTSWALLKRTCCSTPLKPLRLPMKSMQFV